MNIEFYLTSIFLGAGLAMDACAVAMANGFKEPKMKPLKVFCIAFFFAVFQGFMPLVGYFIGHSLLFLICQWIPWISLFTLSILGINMILSTAKKDKQDDNFYNSLSIKLIVGQAFATSLDALSAGIAFSNFSVTKAFLCSIIIAIVTFVICMFGIICGKKFGKVLGGKAEIAGGIILILIGLKIFISSFI